MSSRVAVTCPSCSTRLQLRLPAGDGARIKVRCSVCETAFLIRRPGVSRKASAPPTSEPSPPPGSPAPPPRPSATSQAATHHIGSAPGVPAISGIDAPSVAVDRSPLTRGGPGATPPTLSPSSSRHRRTTTLADDAVLAERYRIVRFLAEGGMGEVYEAEDLELKGRVALKTVRPEAARDQLAVDRFRREIQLARRVTHPNVCRIYDVSRHLSEDGDEMLFLSMELLAGETLAQRVEGRGPMEPREALPLVRQMAEGLAAAHRVGVIHRDFKSANVMLSPAPDDEGGVRAVITDFGLARVDSGDGGVSALTLVDSVIGTPAYMAPEQVQGGEITAAVDIYALGVVLFEMMTGRMPFQGENALSTAVKRLQEPAPSPRLHVPDLDPHWEAVILRCLEKDSAARYAAAPEIHQALVALAGSPGATGSLPAVAVSPRLPVGASIAGTLGPGPGTWVTGGSGPQADGSVAGGAATASVSVAGIPAATLEASSSSAAPPAVRVDSARGGRRYPSRDRFTIVGLLLLIALTAFFAWRQVESWREGRLATLGDEALLERSVSRRPTVAVLGLENLATSAEDDWIGTAVAEMLAAELGSDALRTVPSEPIARARRELSLDAVGQLDEGSVAASFSSAVGAQYLVAGTYLTTEGDDGGALRFDVALRDRSGARLASVSRTGARDDLLSLVSELGVELRQALDTTDAGGDAGRRARAALPEDPGARRLYAEGLERLRNQEALEARDLLREAVAAAPESALARAALADAWAALGHVTQAQEEARQALTLASSLPQEEALWIEARYLELSGRWGPAAELYRQLWHAFPDDSDYALKVADSLTNAGRGEEALSTLSVLRRLVPDLEDARVDLAEARAAAAIGDFERQRGAAAAAAQQARDSGAGLLLAEARVLEAWALRNLGGDTAVALAAVEEGEALYSAAGDAPGRAFALTNLANLRFDQADFDGARAGFESAAAIYRELGDGAGLARTQNALALVAKRQGRMEQAESLYEESLALCRDLGNELMEAPVLNNYATLLVARGELVEADRRFQRALELRRRAGDKNGEAAVLDNIAVVQRKRALAKEAEQTHRQALALHAATENRPAAVATHGNLARALLAVGSLDLARLEAERAVELARDLNREGLLAAALEAQGETLAATGDLSAAEDRYRAALEIYQRRGESARFARSTLGLARRLLEQGEALAAQEEASRAVEALRDEGAVDYLAAALAVEARAIVLFGDLEAAAPRLLEAEQQAAVSRNMETRVDVMVARAAAQRRGGQAARALSELNEAQESLDLGSHRALQLTVRLARLEAAVAAGEAGARDEQSAFVEIARQEGFETLARQAADL